MMWCALNVLIQLVPLFNKTTGRWIRKLIVQLHSKVPMRRLLIQIKCLSLALVGMSKLQARFQFSLLIHILLTVDQSLNAHYMKKDAMLTIHITILK